jgi:hypothetical protein
VESISKPRDGGLYAINLGGVHPDADDVHTLLIERLRDRGCGIGITTA